MTTTYLGEMRTNWRYAAAAAVGMGFGYSLFFYAGSVFSTPLVAEFGWSKAQFALLGTILIINVVCLPVIGRLTDIFGVRRVVLFGIIAGPLVFAALSMIDGSFGLFLALNYVLAIVHGTTTSSTVFGRLIAQRFEKARGLALSIMAGTPAIAAAIAVPLLTWTIDHQSWRAAYLAHLRAISTQALEWEILGEFATSLHTKIDAMAKQDDKALASYTAFGKSLQSLQRTAMARHQTLQEHACMQGPWPELSDLRAEGGRHGERDAKLAVCVRSNDASKVANVWLHVSTARRGPFAAVVLHDDGQHGDGADDDGVFGGSSEPFAPNEAVHYYIEALDDGEQPKAAFLPAAASGRPLRAELDDKKR